MIERPINQPAACRDNPGSISFFCALLISFPPLFNNHLVRTTGFCCLGSFSVLCYCVWFHFVDCVFECYLECVAVA